MTLWSPVKHSDLGAPIYRVRGRMGRSHALVCRCIGHHGAGARRCTPSRTPMPDVSAYERATARWYAPVPDVRPYMGGRGEPITARGQGIKHAGKRPHVNTDDIVGTANMSAGPFGATTCPSPVPPCLLVRPWRTLWSAWSEIVRDVGAVSLVGAHRGGMAVADAPAVSHQCVRSSAERGQRPVRRGAGHSAALGRQWPRHLLDGHPAGPSGRKRDRRARRSEEAELVGLGLVDRPGAGRAPQASLRAEATWWNVR